MSKKRNLPKEIFVYVGDEHEGGEPVYYVVTKVDEIPEERDGEQVGVYALNRQYVFRVRRELK